MTLKTGLADRMISLCTVFTFFAQGKATTMLAASRRRGNAVAAGADTIAAGLFRIFARLGRAAVSHALTHLTRTARFKNKAHQRRPTWPQHRIAAIACDPTVIALLAFTAPHVFSTIGGVTVVRPADPRSIAKGFTRHASGGTFSLGVACHDTQATAAAWGANTNAIGALFTA